MTWTAESYYAKAYVYWTKATSRDRANEDFLLNVAFAVEFVARGTICHVNPALNAATDLESILFACGQEPRAPIKTIDFFDVIKRLQRLVPDLTEIELQKVRTLIDIRNGELHGDKTGMNQINPDSIMPSIYSFFVKAAKFADQSLAALLGPEDAQLAQQTANAITKDRTTRVRDLIKVCKDRFFSLTNEQQSQMRESSKTQVISAVLASGHHLIYVKCPACAQTGQLVATPVGRSAPILRGDELVQEVRVIPMQFTCKCCNLDIKGLDELMAAGFSHEYRSFDDVDPLEHFNINPHDYVDPEEIAREYHRDMYEYQDE
ncbi:hypothetical protein [Arsukibacterium perlucidum]|uniref:hypothetical protein n=1 Tax=Arsukibacterium perlucidum TaxID=368811 RepID=UPI00036CF8DE|nr:hypothetical protein [Arsukibacterium perlucidum]